MDPRLHGDDQLTNMKKIIFIIIFLALLASAVYAVEKMPSIKGVTTVKKEEPSITPTPTDSQLSIVNPLAGEVDSQLSSPSADVVFNIPLLLTKKIDDLNKIIGEPFPGQPINPPADGHTNSNTWQRGFEKNGVKLYANYNIDNGTINSLAILGDKREVLLKQGNLDEKSKKYILGNIEINPTKYMGITVSASLPEQVNITLNYKDSEKVMEITNNEDWSIPKCTITFDNGFFHEKFDGIAAKKTEKIIFDLFVRKGGPRGEGERWINSTESKPKYADVVCDGWVQKGRKAHIVF